MAKYLVKRLLLLFVTLFGITLITFILTRLTPGDPAAMKITPGSGGSVRAQAGFDDLLEQNRRNLGLDKPHLINLNFEDRDYLADRALDDFLRNERLWQQIGEKALNRVNTIALPAALRRFEQIGTPEQPKVRDTRGREAAVRPAEEAKKAIADLFPKLALDQAPATVKTPEQAHAYWKQWLETNKSRFDDAAVERTVEGYFDGKMDVIEVRKAGGYAIPHLVEGLHDPDRAEKANTALSTITTFNFLSSPNAWNEEKDRAIARWDSFWRREKPRYAHYNAVQHGINIFANTQFGYWVKQVALFDFGDSYRNNQPVIELIKERLPRSIALAVSSILLAYIVAIPLGIYSAVKRYTVPDRIVTVMLFLLYSLPSFWVASMLIMTTTGGTGDWPEWFPTRGMVEDGKEWGTPGVSFWDSLSSYAWHMALPVFVMTYGSIAFISRQMRSAMLETIKQDYVRTAQAKGVSEFSVVFRHALRNSLIPIITISAGILPELIAGSIIVESIFTIRGMGHLTFEAIINRDYPIINAELFFSAFLTLLGILVADILYAFVDPRISYD